MARSTSDLPGPLRTRVRENARIIVVPGCCIFYSSLILVLLFQLIAIVIGFGSTVQLLLRSWKSNRRFAYIHMLLRASLCARMNIGNSTRVNWTTIKLRVHTVLLLLLAVLIQYCSRSSYSYIYSTVVNKKCRKDKVEYYHQWERDPHWHQQPWDYWYDSYIKHLDLLYLVWCCITIEPTRARAEGAGLLQYSRCL